MQLCCDTGVRPERGRRSRSHFWVHGASAEVRSQLHGASGVLKKVHISLPRACYAPFNVEKSTSVSTNHQRLHKMSKETPQADIDVAIEPNSQTPEQEQPELT